MTHVADTEKDLFVVSPELLSNIQTCLYEKDQQKLLALVNSLHPADVADLVESMSSAERAEFFRLIQWNLHPEVFAELSHTVREEVLDSLEPTVVAAAVADLDSDDAAHVVGDLDDIQKEQVLQAIPKEERAVIEEVLNYPEFSAGRLMQTEVVTVPAHWTIKETKNFLAEAENLPDIFYDVYVLNDKQEPVGGVSLHHLFRNSSSLKIEEVMDTQIKRIPVLMDQEEVAYLFQQYGLISTPVVSQEGKMIGVITVDDAVTVLQEEATDDILKLGGVEESDIHTPIMETTKWRLRWLFVTFIDTLIASSVIYQFQEALEKIVALAILMPIVAAMGGNAGMQVVTVTVRALATRDILSSKVMMLIRKELAVAGLNGLFFAVILAGIAAGWFYDPVLGAVLGAAMIFNILWAGFAGTVFPLLLHRFGFDPAISAGPILTTTTDVLGFASFLGLATLFLL
jgi:magnesium transporter